MRLNVFSVFLVAVPLLPFYSDLQAEEMERQAEVQRVRFSNAQPAGINRNWRQVEIQLNVRGSADREVANPRYIDNVEVELNLAIQVRGGDVETTRFYRSSMELPTLEMGRHTVHFFLPPEVVSRDRVSGDPQAYLVALSVDGVEQTLSTNARSQVLERESVRQSFLERVESEAGANDGILLPIHLTPFVSDHRYLREMPSVRRRDQQ